MLKVNDVQASVETDQLIHENVLKRTGPFPSYSSDDFAAQELAHKFKLMYYPGLPEGSTLPPAGQDLKAMQPIPWTYCVTQAIPLSGQPMDVSQGLQNLARADTYALAISRSVLLLHNLAEL